MPSKKTPTTIEDLETKAFEAGSKVRALYDNAGEEAQALVRKAEQHLHEKPLQTGLMALGAGLILGLLLNRR